MTTPNSSTHSFDENPLVATKYGILSAAATAATVSDVLRNNGRIEESDAAAHLSRRFIHLSKAYNEALDNLSGMNVDDIDPQEFIDTAFANNAKLTNNTEGGTTE